MSVQVAIDIGQGMARRHLKISRSAGGDHPGDPHTYQVVLYGVAPKHMDPRRWERGKADFEHKYDDDVLTLITEAIAALRQEGVEQA